MVKTSPFNAGGAGLIPSQGAKSQCRRCRGSLGQEDPLEKEMTIHSGTLAWEIPWTEEPGELQSKGS